MTQKLILTGTADKGNGDPIRTAFTKVNDNFTELYANLNLGSFEFTDSTISTTDSTAIVIDQATTVTSNLTVGGDILPQTAYGGDLGSSTLPWRSLYVSNSTIFLGGVPLSLDANNNLTVNGSQVGGGVTSYADLTGKPVLSAVATSGSYNDLTNKPNLGGTYQFSVAADDSTQRVISSGELVKFTGAGGITTASDAEGNITINYVQGNIRSENTINIDINLSDSTLRRWQFGEDGDTVFPNNISINYSGNNIQFPRIIADSGKAFSVQGQGTSGSAALSWTVDPDAAGQYAAVAVSKAGGDNLAKVILQAQSDSGDAGTAKIWKFDETGSLELPNGSVIKDTDGYAVAFGLGAGFTGQGTQAVAVGSGAGFTTQGTAAVAIGSDAGGISQGINAVAVGAGAGYTGQGINAVAIGIQAGYTNQGANSIIINATGATLNQTTANTFTVKPVRQGETANAMYYNSSTGEITYADAFSFSVAGDDSTQRLISNNELIKFIGAGGVTTASDAEGNITITGTVPSSLVNGAHTLSLGSTGTLTLPEGSTVDESLEIVTVTLDQFTSAGLPGTRVFNKVSDTLYELSPAGAFYTRMELVGGIWRLRVSSSTYYDSTDLITWGVVAGSSPTPVGTLTTVVTTNLAVGSSVWGFGEDGALTLPAGSSRVTSYGQLTIETDNSGSGMYANATGSNLLYANTNVTLRSNTAGTTKDWTFGTDGSLTIPGDIRSEGNIDIEINLADSTLRRWQFGEDGNLTLPAGGNISEGGGLTGAIRLTPAGGANANQALLIYPTAGAEGDHIHLTAGGGSTELYLGDDLHFVKLTSDGFVAIKAYDGVNGAVWGFSPDGTTSIPGNIKSDNNINIDINLTDSTLRRWQFGEDGILTVPGPISGLGNAKLDFTTYANVAYLTSTSNDTTALYMGSVSAELYAQTNILIRTNTDGTSKQWTFGDDGSLTLPNGAVIKDNDYVAVAFGLGAGTISQGISAVAVGFQAGGNNQGNSAVAIGELAGNTSQGANAVAIGRQAGNTAQAANTIILNATGNELNQTTANTFTVAPIRNISATSGVLQYNASTKEVSYSNNVTAQTFNTDQITVVGNRISTTLTNANLELECNGSGGVVINTLAEATTASTARSAGYLGIPASAVSTTNTLTIADAGEHIYVTTNSQTITIPANASVAYPIGTTLTFIAGPSATTVTIAITSDTLRLAGGTSTGTRTLAANGMATAVKVAATTWYINGTGLT